MPHARTTCRTITGALALSLGLTMVGCAGTPAKSRITFVSDQPATTTVASAHPLGSGWASAASTSAPATFLALGAGDRLGRQVRQNDYVIAMGKMPQGATRVADVPVTDD
ncbi:MAG: hypothetical protein KDA20_13295 [Phycisphaerales bacterium]|nr:hypothetical protein [Phycisphaerales bacterium]